MKLLSWQEPRAYRHALYRHEIQGNRWLRPKLAAFFFCGSLFLWLLAHLNPSATPPAWWIALPMIVGFAFALAYGLPWLLRFIPSEVRLLERKIVRIHGNSARHVPVAKIRGYTFDHLHGFGVVRLEIEKQAPLICALTGPEQQAVVERTLAELRVPPLKR